MAKYRKRPLVIEAVQYTCNDYGDNPFSVRERPAPAWFIEATKQQRVRPVFLTEDYWYLDIETLEGTMRCRPDDWIVRGVQGELYPVKDGIFKATYEPADAEG